MQFLDQDSQLLENDITDTMFAKTHGVIVLDLSSTQDMRIVRTGSAHLDCIFVIPLVECILLISLNKFETYREITPKGSILLDHAS